MTDAAKAAPAPAPFKAGSPPGDAQWCATCAAWRPDAAGVVVQGNTMGACTKHKRRSLSNAWCEQHQERPAGEGWGQ